MLVSEVCGSTMLLAKRAAKNFPNRELKGRGRAGELRSGDKVELFGSVEQVQRHGSCLTGLDRVRFVFVRDDGRERNSYS